MDKIKTSAKRKSSISKKSRKSKANKSKHIVVNQASGLIEYDPIRNLLDVNKMGAAIMQCLMDNDTDGVLEIIENYLYAVNKSHFLKEANVPRSTVYNFFRRRNPTIKTLAKIMHASTIDNSGHFTRK